MANKHPWFPEVIGSTQIKDFLDDPMKWYRIALAGGVSEENAAMYRGNLWHAAIGNWYHAKWASPGIGIRVEPPDLDDRDLGYAETTAIELANYWATNCEEAKMKPLTLAGVPMVEHYFELNLEGMPCKLAGKVDYAGETLPGQGLIDWKTCNTKLETFQDYNVNNVQHLIYGLWYFTEVDPLAVSVPFTFVLIGRDGKFGPVCIRRIPITVQLNEVTEWTESVLRPVAWGMHGMYYKDQSLYYRSKK